MNSRQWLAAGFGLALALNGLGGPIEQATYSNLFNRAAGLVPGSKTVALDLKQAGAWEIVGGQRVDTDKGFTVQAQATTVEIIWKGTFPCELPAATLGLELDVDTPVAAQLMLYGLHSDRFNRLGNWMPVEPKAKKPLQLSLAGDKFKGFKLAFEAKELSGKTIGFNNLKLSTSFYEGFFRREVEIPAGEIWEAVAEVGNLSTLYVNGKRVDDGAFIMPRALDDADYGYMRLARYMYMSKRQPLKPYLKPGRNVLGLYVVRPLPNNAMAYLRGSVIMASGARILLDTGTNWAWKSAAPANWFAPDYAATDWSSVLTNGAKLGLMYQFGFPSRPRGDMPCYDGLIKLRNPTDSKLYFEESRPLELSVTIPPGFAGGKPELAWEISRYEADQTFKPAAKGTVAGFQPQGDSLTGAIKAPEQARGIYVLTCRLQVNGQTVEEREPEVLVVTGKIKMPVCAGDTLEQGLDLKLEKVVDFTDPKDPHPWFETDHKGPMPGAVQNWGPEYYHTLDQPLIVERNGLKYRTTRPVSWAQFSYRVDFAHPGDWYLLVLEYPDDAERWIGVSCNAGSRTASVQGQKPSDAYGACSKCGPSIWTGGKYPNTGKMLEMKWIYRPDPGSHAFNVMSLMKNTEAAAARLRIYHIAGQLPELDAGPIPARDQRRFGMLTERTYPWESGIYNLFSSLAKVPFSSRGDTGAGNFTNNAVLEGCVQFSLMEDAASHYAEYLRFAGQNLHTMGCYQYNDRNTAPQYLTGDPRVQYNPQDMLARVLRANGISFYASVEYANSARTREVKPEWYFGNRAGPLPATSPYSPGRNFLHPDIEGDMLTLARTLAENFKDQPNFRGINWTAYFGGSWLPGYRKSGDVGKVEDIDPLELGYDDFTVGVFEKETGVKIPVDAGTPERFEKRHQFLTSAEMKPRWMAWRAQKLAGFFAKVEQILQAARPDLETVASCYVNHNHVAEWKHLGIPFRDYLDRWGWSVDAFKDQKGVWLMPWLQLSARYQPAYRTMEYAMAWQGNHDPGFYLPFAGLDRRAVMLCVGWIEVERIAGNYPYREGWPRPYQQTMMGQQREELALEPYTQALMGLDPQMVMMGFTDVSPYVGAEDAQRKFARVLRRLPWGRFEPVLGTGFDSNFAIRALRAGDQYHFYVVNPGYWPIKGTVTVTGAARVTDAVSGKELALKDSAVAVELAPFGVAAFTATGPQAQVSAWQTAPPAAADLAHLQGILAEAKKAAANRNTAGFLGDQDFGVLTNTVAQAEKALAEQRYAAAWQALTDAFFWTVLFQKIPDMQFADIIKPRTMIARRIGGDLGLKLDGVLDDRIWEERYCKPVNNFVTMDKEYSKVRTTVRAACVKNRLLIAIECADAEPDKIRGTADKADEKRIWEAADDLVAFFIMPNATNYYQFALSAGGAKFDQRCSTAGERDYNYAPNWKAAVGKNSKGWAVEIDLDTQEAFGAPIPINAEWKINFHRLFRLKEQAISSWVYSPNWHSLEHMGAIRFEELGK